jgi:hypothetical protein
MQIRLVAMITAAVTAAADDAPKTPRDIVLMIKTTAISLTTVR